MTIPSELHSLIDLKAMQADLAAATRGLDLETLSRDLAAATPGRAARAR